MDYDQFTIYLQYLYTERLVINDEEAAEEVEQGQEDGRKHQNFEDSIAKLIELASLGDWLRDTSFRNAVNDAFIATIHKYGSLPGPTHLHSLVDIFPTSSALYRLNVDFFASSGMPKDFEKRGMHYPKQFVLDVIIEMMKRRDGSPQRNEPLWKDRCQYHEHDEKTPFCIEKCFDQAWGGTQERW